VNFLFGKQLTGTGFYGLVTWKLLIFGFDNEIARAAFPPFVYVHLRWEQENIVN